MVFLSDVGGIVLALVERRFSQLLEYLCRQGMGSCISAKVPQPRVIKYCNTL